MTVDVPLPLVGPGVVMRALAARADELRRDVTRPVLLAGARGLGKHYLATRVHAGSALAAQPLLPVDARRVTEAELRTLLETAAPGTSLLLRHVDRLSLAAQEQLEQRTGERSPIARLLATTTADIVARVTAGAFLESLYYRLHAWPMLLPALAVREPADRIALAHAVLAQTADTDTDLPTTLDDHAAAAVVAHPWPDNLRELEAAMALAQLRARGRGLVGVEHLPRHHDTSDATATPPADASLESVERWHVLRAVTTHHGNRTHAARSLGISRMTLIGKLKRFGDGDAP